MAKKTTTTKKLDGVDQIIDYLAANRDKIGAIVIGVAPLANRQLPSFDDGDGKHCDGVYCAADRVGASDDKQRSYTGIGSAMTDGIAAGIAKRHLHRSGGLFG